ncbi:Mss4-like protein [Flagelloscypha sp. PMI_526]|nr:Mss4-like protein [Flagelloscypha sp. PMI_526]
MSAPITGSCLCRSLIYTITVPSSSSSSSLDLDTSICLCTMCRKHSGAIFPPFIIFPSSSIRFHIDSSEAGSELKLEEIAKNGLGTYKEYESSPDNYRAFCGKCGSTLLCRGETTSDVDIYAGTLDEHIILGNIIEHSENGEERGKIPRRDGTGRAKDLIVPKRVRNWENCPAAFADMFAETNRYFGGNKDDTVTQEDVEKLKAQA